MQLERLFDLGQVVVTRNALATIDPEEMLSGLRRHATLIGANYVTRTEQQTSMVCGRAKGFYPPTLIDLELAIG